MWYNEILKARHQQVIVPVDGGMRVLEVGDKIDGWEWLETEPEWWRELELPNLTESDNEDDRPD